MLPLVITFLSEQGRRNNLKPQVDTSVDHSTSKSVVISDPSLSFLVNSKSFHYPPSTHCNVLSGSSCHAVNLRNNSHHELQLLSPYHISTGCPSWAHIFAMRMGNSSLCTQCNAVARTKGEISTIVHHHCKCQAMKKLKKQQCLLQEVVVPPDQLKLSTKEIDNNIIVFDRGNSHCPPIRLPKEIKWRSHHVSELHIQDETSSHLGLTFPCIDGALPFIRLPHKIALDIIGQCGLSKIYNALNACENLQRLCLACSNKKCVFTDYGNHVTYACVGPQASRNSQKVLDNPPFMDKLSSHHWDPLVWLMRCVEECFKTIADHQVISHLYLAKKVVPFKTFSANSRFAISSSKFYGVLLLVQMYSFLLILPFYHEYLSGLPQR